MLKSFILEKALLVRKIDLLLNNKYINCIDQNFSGFKKTLDNYINKFFICF